METIILLTRDTYSAKCVYNAVNDTFGIDQVIYEEPVSRSTFLKRRIKKLGLIKVLDQILFKIFIIPGLRFFSKERISEIKKSEILNAQEIDQDKITHVVSVNNKETIQVLKKINPDVVIVNGTRIISQEVLESIDAAFINMHAGITPTYRGVHGAYWALIQKDTENVGVTVHLVDKGIDTGGILMQKNIVVTKNDSFATYPLLQLEAGIPLLVKSIRNIFDGRIETIDISQRSSQIWSHPGIITYIINRLIHNVK